MHDITDLPAWERLFKKIVWKQLGDMEGKKILDFGSGEGITANHFAEKNDVTAIEPSKEMLSNAWKDYEYTQIVGDVNALSVGTSMMIIRKIKKSWKIQHLVLNNHSLWSILYMSRHV